MANRNLQPLQFPVAGLPKSLNIHYRDPKESPAEYGDPDYYRRHSPGETETIDNNTPVYTTQKTFDPKTVQAYRKSGDMQSGENNTDKPFLYSSEGQLWHNDGLHRMIASRINKASFPAEVNRGFDRDY